MTSRTMAVRRPPEGARPETCGCTASVALVALLGPGIAAVVIAVALPESLLVVVEQGEPGDPLRALPEIQMRYEQPHGSTVIGGQRRAFVAERDPRLAVGHVGQRQVLRIARGR